MVISPKTNNLLHGIKDEIHPSDAFMGNMVRNIVEAEHAKEDDFVKKVIGTIYSRTDIQTRQLKEIVDLEFTEDEGYDDFKIRTGDLGFFNKKLPPALLFRKRSLTEYIPASFDFKVRVPLKSYDNKSTSIASLKNSLFRKNILIYIVRI